MQWKQTLLVEEIVGCVPNTVLFPFAFQAEFLCGVEN